MRQTGLRERATGNRLPSGVNRTSISVGPFRERVYNYCWLIIPFWLCFRGFIRWVPNRDYILDLSLLKLPNFLKS